MSEIINELIKRFDLNKDTTLASHLITLDGLEKKARCLFFVGENVKTSEYKHNSELGSILQEVFLDLTNSIYLIMYSHYRPAYHSLRSALELTVASVYFADHPIEFYKWQKDSIDFHFSNIVKEIFSTDYTEAINSNFTPNQNEILDTYRTLSQYVHGKYEFLSILEDSVSSYNPQRLEKYTQIFSSTFKIIMNCCNFRFKNELIAGSLNYPYLGNFLKLENERGRFL